MAQKVDELIRPVWEALDEMKGANEERREVLIDVIKEWLEELATFVHDKEEEVNKWKGISEAVKETLNEERAVSKTLTNLIKDLLKGDC